MFFTRRFFFSVVTFTGKTLIFHRLIIVIMADINLLSYSYYFRSCSGSSLCPETGLHIIANVSAIGLNSVRRSSAIGKNTDICMAKFPCDILR